MSLLPYILDEIAREARNPLSQLYDENFGLGLRLNDDDFYRRPLIPAVPLLAGYLRPQRHSNQNESGISTIANQKDQFRVNLDVQQFKPDEINVKVAADNFLVVEGKHEEKQDQHGFISRQFTRRYKLPKNVNLEAVQSHLSSDGILSIIAPKKVERNDAKEIQIPIQHTNQPVIKQSQKPASAEEKSAGDQMES